MSEEARNSICPECGSYCVTYEHTDDYDWQQCTCGCCGCSGTPGEFFHNSVFARITASPEVLAPYLVYIIRCEEEPSLAVWASNIVHSVVFFTKSDAIAATVEKLKEIYK